MYSIELTVVIPRWNNPATKEGRSQCPTTWQDLLWSLNKGRMIVSIIWRRGESVGSYYSCGESVRNIDISQNNCWARQWLKLNWVNAGDIHETYRGPSTKGGLYQLYGFWCAVESVGGYYSCGPSVGNIDISKNNSKKTSWAQRWQKWNGVGTGDVDETYRGSSTKWGLYQLYGFRCGGESVLKMATAETIRRPQVEHGDGK